MLAADYYYSCLCHTIVLLVLLVLLVLVLVVLLM